MLNAHGIVKFVSLEMTVTTRCNYGQLKTKEDANYLGSYNVEKPLKCFRLFCV